MRNLVITFIFLSFFAFSATFAGTTQNKFNNLPQGTFKKNKHGQIIQYDNNGKKIGVYKIQTQRQIKTNEFKYKHRQR